MTVQFMQVYSIVTSHYYTVNIMGSSTLIKGLSKLIVIDQNVLMIEVFPLMNKIFIDVNQGLSLE